MLTTQEERERSLKDRVAESDRKWLRVAEEERDRLRDLLREARQYVAVSVDARWPDSPAADLLSRIDKEIGNG